MIFTLAEFEKIETDKTDCWHEGGNGKNSDGKNRLRSYGNTGITLGDCKKFCAALDGCIGFNREDKVKSTCYALKSCENPKSYGSMEYYVLKGILIDCTWKI